MTSIQTLAKCRRRISIVAVRTMEQVFFVRVCVCVLSVRGDQCWKMISLFFWSTIYTSPLFRKILFLSSYPLFPTFYIAK